MSDFLAVVLLLVTGLLLALVIMFTSTGLLGYYTVETARRIVRTARTWHVALRIFGSVRRVSLKCKRWVHRTDTLRKRK